MNLEDQKTSICEGANFVGAHQAPTPRRGQALVGGFKECRTIEYLLQNVVGCDDECDEEEEKAEPELVKMDGLNRRNIFGSFK